MPSIFCGACAGLSSAVTGLKSVSGFACVAWVSTRHQQQSISLPNLRILLPLASHELRENAELVFTVCSMVQGAACRLEPLALEKPSGSSVAGDRGKHAAQFALSAASRAASADKYGATGKGADQLGCVLRAASDRELLTAQNPTACFRLILHCLVVMPQARKDAKIPDVPVECTRTPRRQTGACSAGINAMLQIAARNLYFFISSGPAGFWLRDRQAWSCPFPTRWVSPFQGSGPMVSCGIITLLDLVKYRLAEIEFEADAVLRLATGLVCAAPPPG